MPKKPDLPRKKGGKRFESIDKLPSGRWRARWHVNGERQSRVFLTKRDAQAHLAILRADKYRGPIAPPQARKPLSEWLGLWMASVTPNVAPQSARSYRTAVNHLNEALGSTPLDVLAPSDVQHFVNEFSATHAPNSTAAVVQVLRAALKQAQAQRLISLDPMAGVKMPRKSGTSKREAPTPDEVALLIEKVYGHHAGAVHLMTMTGCRWGEAYAVSKSDFHFEREGGSTIVFRASLQQNGKVRPFTKTGAVRIVPLDENLAEHLAVVARWAKTEHLFPQMTYTRWRNTVWLPACDRASLPGLQPHDLRRFVATQLDLAGVSQRARMDLLGHTSALVASRYLLRTTEAARQATSALEAAFNSEA